VRTLRSGLELIEDVVGTGAPVQRHASYVVRLRMWLRRGDPIRWDHPSSESHPSRIEDDGATLFASMRVDRIQMFPGLFHGVDGMRVGGTRRLRVSPHLGFGETGVPGHVPANALLNVEVTIVSEV
jgi:hypothetical protein